MPAVDGAVTDRLLNVFALVMFRVLAAEVFVNATL